MQATLTLTIVICWHAEAASYHVIETKLTKWKLHSNYKYTHQDNYTLDYAVWFYYLLLQNFMHSSCQALPSRDLSLEAGDSNLS